MRGPAVRLILRRRRIATWLSYDPRFELLFLLQARRDGVRLAAFLVFADAHAEDRRRSLGGRDHVGGIAFAGKPLHDHVGLVLLTKRRNLDRKAWSARLGRCRPADATGSRYGGVPP